MATPLTLVMVALSLEWPFVAKGIGADMLLKMEVSRVQFIPPALPKPRPLPRAGDGWLFELKFDGYRVQLHKADLSSVLYGRNGGDLTRRFPRIAAAALGLPTRSCIIDGELITAGVHGQPDFLALLHGRHVPVCVYAFEPPAICATSRSSSGELGSRRQLADQLP